LRPASTCQDCSGYRQKDFRDSGRLLHYDCAVSTTTELANQGISMLEAGRNEEAARIFIEARKSDPDSPDLAFNLGLARLRDGRVRDARTAFEQSLALGGENPDLLANLGLAQFELGKETEAEKAYRRALELAPGHPEAANNLGVLMFGKGRFADARESFILALRSREDYIEAWFNLRDTCAELGLDEERNHAAIMVDSLEQQHDGRGSQ